MRRGRTLRARRRASGTVLTVMAATAIAVPLVVVLQAGTGTGPITSTGPNDVAKPSPDGSGSFDCPVTLPATLPLSAPESHPDQPGNPEMAWYGTEDLWTALPIDGDYGPRKSVWWSSSFAGGGIEQTPAIDVVWERLDADDPPITNDGYGTNAHTVADGWFMIAGSDPDEPGCWRVTARYAGSSLSYVYERR
jgi:hypothetical protein